MCVCLRQSRVALLHLELELAYLHIYSDYSLELPIRLLHQHLPSRQPEADAVRIDMLRDYLATECQSFVVGPPTRADAGRNKR